MVNRFTLVLLFILFLAIFIVIAAFIYMNSESEVVQNISLNMIATLIGFILTAPIFERILNEYNKINELKRVKVVAVQFNKALQGYIDIFADIFKSVSLEAKGRVPEELSDFFNKEFYELLEDFDWNSDSPALHGVDYDKNTGYIFHSMPWHEYLVDRFKKLELRYDNLFVKYSAWMTEEMLNNYSRLIDLELSARIEKGKKYENHKQKNEQQTGMKATMLRFPFVCALNSAVDAIIEIDKFNKIHFPDLSHLKVNSRLWASNVAPKMGSSRISSKHEHRYGPKDLLNILKKKGGPIRI